MSESPKTFFLTTPIYYVNARPHIGHAYTTIVGDVLARRARAQGTHTFFLTGTDEHGQKIERSAAAAGIPPQQFADQVSKSFSDLWQRMGITHEKFIRTTDEAHKRGAQKLFATLYERGFIYLASYTGQYCVSDEAFVDVPPGGPCPDCGRITETLTEENFFFKLSEFQAKLIDLIKSSQLVITPDSARNEVLSFIRGNVDSVMPEEPLPSETEPLTPFYIPTPAQQQAIDDGILGITERGTFYVPGTLKDLSISRSSFTWGIPVPEPAASAASQKHVIYVWLDALANYMTALGYGSDDESRWQKFWPADLHIVGKEIIRFHCVYWPAFLMAAGLPLPKQVVAHGWLLFEESKMSKSKGNIVRTETILDAFGTLCPTPPPLTTPDPTQNLVILSEAKDPCISSAPAQISTPEAALEPTPHQRDLFAADILRYFLLREIPFGQDGSFSFDALITRYNADLANGYGNLVSRTLNMMEKYREKIVPAPNKDFLLVDPRPSLGGSGVQTTIYISTENVFLTAETFHFAFNKIGRTEFYEDLKLVWNFVRVVDAYISFHEPWKLAANPAKQLELNEVLYTAAESIRIITALLYPILPYATASVWAQLGLGDIEQAAKTGQLTNLQWGGLEPGTKLGPLAPIFPRADKGLAQTMTDLESPKPEATPAPTEEKSVASVPSVLSLSPEQEPTIAIDDFVKIDLRVAQIVVCERIPKADKLLRLEVDLGTERRQILSGIAEWYTPEELIGRRIVIIANLAPRKMRGLESHGMLLAASAEGGKPYLCTFADAETLPLGSRIK
jgi:methionyl-tRNA synthetase